MVKYARMGLKIGVDLPFGPKSPMEFMCILNKNIWTGLLSNGRFKKKWPIWLIFWNQRGVILKELEPSLLIWSPQCQMHACSNWKIHKSSFWNFK